jgi:Uma2 family endonuclease
MVTQLRLTPADRGRSLMLEEFEHADFAEGFRYELIHGKLEVSPVPNMPHEFLVRWLGRRLDRYTEENPAVIDQILSPARVFVAEESGVTAPEADLAAYRDFPTDAPVEDLRWQDFNPVLVVEVLSEDTAEKDLVRNLELYLLVPSIREYWIFDPRTSASRPTLTVHRRRGKQWQRPVEVPAGGTYTTRFLPGFSLPLRPRA